MTFSCVCIYPEKTSTKVNYKHEPFQKASFLYCNSIIQTHGTYAYIPIAVCVNLNQRKIVEITDLPVALGLRLVHVIRISKRCCTVNWAVSLRP